MKTSYRAELAALAATYAGALGADITEAKTAVSALGVGSALFVGSGGSMVLAELAARLHERVWRHPAQAVTALGLLDLPQLEQRGAMLFSSSAKHPDAQRVLTAFGRGRFTPTAVVTHRAAEQVQALAGADTRIVTLPLPARRDGFLATGSILQIATVLLRAYLPAAELPPVLEDPDPVDSVLRDELLVLTAPSLAAVAADLEVRLAESGLAAVQVTDFRNFAHGRHTGFARRADRTTVIALSDTGSAGLAAATVDALPETTDLRLWHVGGPWEQAVVSLLNRSMHLAETCGERAGVDIARPGVPAFGRRLYHLPLQRRVPHQAAGGVERKLLAAASGDRAEARAVYIDAAEEWSAELRRQRFDGLVLDYDGTVCWTRRRWELPDERLRRMLQSLLDEGLVVGFASGRGRSLHSALRQWVAPACWGRVFLGLYNGAVLLSLCQELSDLRAPTSWSTSVVGALSGDPSPWDLAFEERGPQVSVTIVDGPAAHRRLATAIQASLESAQIDATVTTSGHSIDIVQAGTGKRAVAEAVEHFAGGPALAIGDQGQLGGNDHALLHASQWTLTVDRCSAETDRCWFAGGGQDVGPDLLLRYLRALRHRRDGFAVMGLVTA